MGRRQGVEHAAVAGRRPRPGVDGPAPCPGRSRRRCGWTASTPRTRPAAPARTAARRSGPAAPAAATAASRSPRSPAAQPLRRTPGWRCRRRCRPRPGRPACPSEPAGAAEPVRRDRRDQRERGDPAGRVDDRLHDHAAAEAPADQVDPVQPERVEQRGQVVGPVPHPAGRVHRLRVGVAEPAQVDRQRPVRRRQRQHRRLPEQARGHVAVHEQHRRPLAVPGLQHVLGQPRGRHPAGRDAGHQRGHRALQPPSSTSELPLTNEAASEQR